MFNKMVRQLNGMEIIFYSTIFLIFFTTKITNAADGYFQPNYQNLLMKSWKEQNSEYGNELEDVKPRRGGTVGLFAFPRVGRSDPDMLENWEGVDVVPNSFEDYEMPPSTSHADIKRAHLIAFPRVGRSGSMSRYMSKSGLKNMVKRGGSGANGGMWFGPRLGRVQKRSSDKDLSSFQDNSKVDVYTPRLGRESEEILDDYNPTLLNLQPNLQQQNHQLS